MRRTRTGIPAAAQIASRFQVTTDDLAWVVDLRRRWGLWRAQIAPTGDDIIPWFSVMRWGTTRDQVMARAETWMREDARYTESRRRLPFRTAHQPRPVIHTDDDLKLRITCCHSCSRCLPQCLGTSEKHGFYSPQASRHLNRTEQVIP